MSVQSCYSHPTTRHGRLLCKHNSSGQQWQVQSQKPLFSIFTDMKHLTLAHYQAQRPTCQVLQTMLQKLKGAMHEVRNSQLGSKFKQNRPVYGCDSACNHVGNVFRLPACDFASHILCCSCGMYARLAALVACRWRQCSPSSNKLRLCSTELQGCT